MREEEVEANIPQKNIQKKVVNRFPKNYHQKANQEWKWTTMEKANFIHQTSHIPPLKMGTVRLRKKKH